MIDSSNKCLSCDVFKNVVMLNQDACVAPTNPGIVGYKTWYEAGTSALWRFQVTDHSNNFDFPDVFITSKVGGAPTAMAETSTDNGKNIFVKNSGDFNSQESYSLASKNPYLYGKQTVIGVNWIVIFAYGPLVPKSVIAFRSPSHVFGLHHSSTTNADCPSEIKEGEPSATKCNGNQITGTDCTASQACSCKTNFAGIACEEIVDSIFTDSFSESETKEYGNKIIVETTTEAMEGFSFNEMIYSITESTNKAGGQSPMAMCRGYIINGNFSKTTWDDGLWTGNSYLPGLQQKYWSGAKDLGEERRRLRMLSRVYMIKSYQMTVVLDKPAYTTRFALKGTEKIYNTIVNVYNQKLTISMESLERGMPLALMIIIPTFSIGGIALMVLIFWCLFGGGEGGNSGDAGGSSSEARKGSSEESKGLQSQDHGEDKDKI